MHLIRFHSRTSKTYFKKYQMSNLTLMLSKKSNIYLLTSFLLLTLNFQVDQYVTNPSTNHIPSSQAILKIGHYTSIAENVNFFADGNHRFDHASSFPFYELLHIKNAPHNGWGKGAPTVGNDVWIGRDSKIMSGVHISTPSRAR